MEKDPYNLVVTGVGGQGNVLASQLIGAILVDIGLKVTIGETYGASQRGGSVMSHVRISGKRQYGPLIPPRCADLVLALEPSEAARVLGEFGNPSTISVVNTRPVYPVDQDFGAGFLEQLEDRHGCVVQIERVLDERFDPHCGAEVLQQHRWCRRSHRVHWPPRMRLKPGHRGCAVVQDDHEKVGPVVQAVD